MHPTHSGWEHEGTTIQNKTSILSSPAHQPGTERSQVKFTSGPFLKYKKEDSEQTRGWKGLPDSVC